MVARSDWLLGPDTVSWRVLTVPWVPLVGGIRTLIIEALHPHAMRGVYDHSDYLARPMGRLQRTSEYVAATALGTVEEADRAASRVRAVHRKVRGHDPVTGRDYSAEEPEAQVWVHFVQWYSYLVSHRLFVGDLTPGEEDAYCAEGVRVAALLDTPEEMVPASVSEAHAYFERVQPELCVTAGTRDAINLVTGRLGPSARELLTGGRLAFEKALTVPVGRTFGSAAVATIPLELRRLAGIERSAIQDAAAIAAVRAALPGLSSPAGMAIYNRALGARVTAVGRRAREVNGRAESQSAGLREAA